MRADGLAQAMPCSGMFNLSPEQAWAVPDRERYIAPRRLTLNPARTGGRALISGGEEVLPGLRRDGAESGGGETEPLPCPAWLFQAGPPVPNQLASIPKAAQVEEL